MGQVRIGTCSWTDRTMVEAWYPPSVRSPEGRLRHYASYFDTVEADSPYYAIPDPSVTAKWTERTPPGFLFHVKAYGMMTRHPVLERSLPPSMRGLRYRGERGRVVEPSEEMLDAAFEEFRRGVAPLVDADRLGGVLLQFPPWFTAMDEERARENEAYIEAARERLEGMRLLVEFRHRSWVEGKRLPRTLGLLKSMGAAYVGVDGPRLPESVLPPIAAATSDWAYVRFHGRNGESWSRRTGSAAERFDYLYEEHELREWESPIRRLAGETALTFVMFNNCKRDYAPRNAARMQEILADVASRPYPGPPHTLF